MKAKLIHIIMAIAFLPLWVNGQDTTFIYTYGGKSYDEGSDLEQTSDSGFIMLGTTGSFGNGNSDIYVVKTDSLGTYQWSKTYGGAASDIGLSIAQTYDGGYIITGYTNSFGAGAYDVYLVKTNSTGDTTWTQTYGGSDWDFGYSVKQTADSGYIITGETSSFGNGGNDIYLIRTDAMGDTLWTKTYGGTNMDYGRSVQITFDGGYIIAGGTSSFGAGKVDAYVVRTDVNGDTLWTNTFGGSEDDFANAIIQSLDTGFAFIGTTESFGYGAKDGYFLKMTKNGNFSWYQTFVGSTDDEGKDLKQLANAGYLLIGTVTGFGEGEIDFVFYITDPGGWSLYNRTYGSLLDDVGDAVEINQNGGYALFGTTNGYGVGLTDFYLITVDTIGHDFLGNPITNSAPGIPIEDTVLFLSASYSKDIDYNSLLVYPNPNYGKFKLQISSSSSNSISYDLKVFNILGQEVINLENITTETEINAQYLMPGVYLYRGTSNKRSEENFSGKISILKN